METKRSNVIARVEPEVKKKAEAILNELGITASGGINMFYRQIILWNGLPFRPTIPAFSPKSIHDMTKEEFDAKLSQGYMQAKAGEGTDADMFFDTLRQEIINPYV